MSSPNWLTSAESAIVQRVLSAAGTTRQGLPVAKIVTTRVSVWDRPPGPRMVEITMNEERQLALLWSIIDGADFEGFTFVGRLEAVGAGNARLETRIDGAAIKVPISDKAIGQDGILRATFILMVEAALKSQRTSDE